MESLSDDCQLLIIGSLGLKGQLKLWEATASIASSRLPSNIIYHWQHKPSWILDNKMLAYLEEHPKQLEGLLSGISGTVQQLELQYIKSYELQRWIMYSFPKLRELSFSLDDGCEAIEELVHEVLVDIFPDLTSLQLSGKFYSKIIQKWPELRRLDLSDCDCEPAAELSMCNFLKLEEITVQTDFLFQKFIDSTVVLPNLRTFCFYGEDKTDQVLNWIIDKRAEISRISFNDSIWYCGAGTLEKMKHLRQLTLVEDEGFEAYQLKALLKCVPQLRQLDLVNLQIWGSESELWQTVSQCNSLQVLNIYGMQLDESFFDIGRYHMRSVLSKRSTPLQLLCDNMNNPQMDKSFKHTNLIVKKGPLCDNIYIDVGYIKVEFDPLVTVQ
ncbi:uncharacterized protein Dmoj_GI16596, isoform B [Drosophila mojavensis]|uniref:Uncharacterized protein, isoform A n=1 Tax=Drosophila mojavensis TaxID=7230 RepID=B4KFS2_DROMO|nr:uncharacterized protein Dmoj_GI16596, isoform A [Drosophila mojavensis]KRG02510.1 uncharacterized protein Dmoj_GI16596, isoform B [Drosophila mojavensis]